MSNTKADDEFRHIAQRTAVALGLEQDYESEQLEFFGKALRQANRFLDIGAHRGLYARLATNVLRDGYIGLVEANPKLAKTLEDEAPTWLNNNNNKIEVFSTAAGDVSGSLPMSVEDHTELGSLVVKSSSDARTVLVDVTPLDRIFAPRDSTLIKIDVEGFEYRAILGAKRLLSGDTRVIVEMHGWGDGKKFPVHVFWLMYVLGFAGSQIGASYSWDFVRAPLLRRTSALLRVWPRFAGKYLIRCMGLRPLFYRIFWPDLVARAGR